MFFCFKQKTAYEMRISDWSSDVCSSDLAVYTREGCWYCHSQFVRPVTGETRRWGPVAQSGEYAFDTPHLFSTRRIGPDLSRVGLKYSDEWHLAHFWDPRIVVPDSIRSEEHTSELQSLMRISYDVFCLKKKKSIQYTT